MYSFAASEFYTTMRQYPRFRADHPPSPGGVPGTSHLRYTDDHHTVVFVGSAYQMRLRITRQKDQKHVVVLDHNFESFADLKQRLGEILDA